MVCLAGKLGVPNWAERLTIPGNYVNHSGQKG